MRDFRIMCDISPVCDCTRSFWAVVSTRYHGKIAYCRSTTGFPRLEPQVINISPIQKTPQTNLWFNISCSFWGISHDIAYNYIYIYTYVSLYIHFRMVKRSSTPNFYAQNTPQLGYPPHMIGGWWPPCSAGSNLMRSHVVRVRWSRTKLYAWIVDRDR
jgi:hypothetical protein